MLMGFVAPIIGALTSFAGTAGGAAALSAGAGIGTSLLTRPKAPKSGTPAPLTGPRRPDPEASRSAAERQRRRAGPAAGRQGTILSGPSGLSTEAGTAVKTLLGL